STSSVNLGSSVTYTVNVTNLGPNTASDVVLNDVLPVGLSFVSANSTIGNCTNNNGTIICNLGVVTNGGRATMTLVVTTTVPGNLTNSVTASSRAADSNPSNSSMSTTISVVPPYP